MSVYIDTYKIKLFGHEWNEKKKKSEIVQCGEIGSTVPMGTVSQICRKCRA